MNKEEIEHYGVLGMKWGQRKLTKNVQKLQKVAVEHMKTQNSHRDAEARIEGRIFALQNQIMPQRANIIALENNAQGQIYKSQQIQKLTAKTKQQEVFLNKKQEKALLKARKKTDADIRKGANRLSKMTPEEAAEFTAKVERIKQANKAIAENQRVLNDAKSSEARAQAAQIATISSALKVVKESTTLNKGGDTDATFKALSDGVTGISKALNELKNQSHTQ